MMRRLIEPPTNLPTPAQAERIRQVHDLAAEFATLPHDQRLAYLDGTVRTQTSGYDRFKTITYTPPDSMLFVPLLRLLDALVASEVTTAGRTHDTKHGLFTDADLRDAQAMTTRTEIVFPVRYPWAVKPVVENGVVIKPGIRGEAVFRSPAERAAGPEHTGFSVVPPLRVVDDDDDPWRTA